MDDKTYATNVGETVARLYFETKGFHVYVGSGKSEFDLILSKDRELYTVQVKTVTVPKYTDSGMYYEVQLKSVRANKTENTIKKFSNAGLDYLVVIDLNNLKIAVIDAETVLATSGMRLYSDRFIDIMGSELTGVSALS